MIGSIAGDVVGSRYEWAKTKDVNFELFGAKSRFTDDSVLSVAIADALLQNSSDYARFIRLWARKYPDRGYGGYFKKWYQDDHAGPYQSFGNGSAMRVSPVGFAFASLEKTLEVAQATAVVTHDHPEGIKGAQALAMAIFLAREGQDKSQIRDEVSRVFGYDLQRTCAQIRPRYEFDVTCPGSVPEAIIAFLDSEDVESAIRLAVSLGGDADTQACMAGGIAQAYYKKFKADFLAEVEKRMTLDVRQVVREFEQRFSISYEIV